MAVFDYTGDKGSASVRPHAPPTPDAAPGPPAGAPGPERPTTPRP